MNDNISHFITSSLSYILEEMSEPKYPPFELRMELKDSQIKYEPDVRMENDENLLTYVRSMTSYVESLIHSVPHILPSESSTEVNIIIIIILGLFLSFSLKTEELKMIPQKYPKKLTQPRKRH